MFNCKKATDYRLRIYQRNSSRFMLIIFWVLALVQFPFGYLLSKWGILVTNCNIYMINGLWLAISNLVFTIYFRKNRNSTILNYVITVFFILSAWVTIFIYRNDLTTKFIWVFCIMLSFLHFERKIVIGTIILSIIGMVSLDLIQPVLTYHGSLLDLYGSSILIIIGLIVCTYLIFDWISQVKFGVDHTLDTVSKGIAYVNHAINNELSLIAICLENMKKDQFQSTERQYEVIDEAILHLRNMVQSFQKNVTTAKDFDLVPYNISQLADECLETFSIIANNKRIQLKKRYDSNIIINCDPPNIKEVIHNLLRNALEAMPEGGEIEVVIKRTYSHINVDIIDNGVGISQEDLPRIIDPFYTTKKYRADNYGIGLTFCNTVMQGHDGSLDIFSEKGKGTKVTLSFPVGG